MALKEFIKKGFKDLNLVDAIAPYPSTKRELVDYVRMNHDVWIPEYESKLTKIVDEVHDRYSEYLKPSKVDNLANTIGYWGDANFAIGNVLGTSVYKMGNAGLKLANHSYNAIKGLFGRGYFAQSPKDYVSLPMLALTDAIAMLPFGTALSPGMSRLVRKRMARDTLEEFNKEIGNQNNLYQRIKDFYRTEVKDRFKSFFRPSYSRGSY